MRNLAQLSVTLAVAVFLSSCARAPQYDVVLRNGSVCDGSGAPCVAGGVAINGDTIADCPEAFTLLQVTEGQLGEFVAAKSAGEQ